MFLLFWLNLNLDGRTNYFDFGGKRSVVRLTVTSQRPILVNAISQEQDQEFLSFFFGTNVHDDLGWTVQNLSVKSHCESRFCRRKQLEDIKLIALRWKSLFYNFHSDTLVYLIKWRIYQNWALIGDLMCFCHKNTLLHM